MGGRERMRERLKERERERERGRGSERGERERMREREREEGEARGGRERETLYTMNSPIKRTHPLTNRSLLFIRILHFPSSLSSSVSIFILSLSLDPSQSRTNKRIVQIGRRCCLISDSSLFLRSKLSLFRSSIFVVVVVDLSSEMAVSLREGFCASGSSALATALDRKKSPIGGTSSSLEISPWKNDFTAKQVAIADLQAGRDKSVKNFSICFPQSRRWWDKGESENMLEIASAQELVDRLKNAGNRLVILNFYSPECGGCRSLHPKICQIAESNPDALFLKINYEEHKSLCFSLNIRVLPFFRFYRGSLGRVCGFSCTNATINKFRDAMAKHNMGSFVQGPAKGLEQAELMKLAMEGISAASI